MAPYLVSMRGPPEYKLTGIGYSVVQSMRTLMIAHTTHKYKFTYFHCFRMNWIFIYNIKASKLHNYYMNALL